MLFTFDASMTLQSFLDANKQLFEQTLLAEAEEIRSDIRHILQKGQIDLLYSAQQVLAYTCEGEQERLRAFADQEGKAWAVDTIDLSFQLEWVHALRRTAWIFIEAYETRKGVTEAISFFRQEREINDCLDLFLNTFVSSYTAYKEALLQEQEALIETLSAPIIPVHASVSILPVTGNMEAQRMTTLKDHVLQAVGEQKLRVLIMDLSGVEYLSPALVEMFNGIINGISLMGCKPIMTGIRPKLAVELTASSTAWNSNVQTIGTLQQALQEYLHEY